MPTILLEQIIELLTGWKDSFFTWANGIGDKIASIKTNTDSLPDIKDNTDDIKDNTAAVITPISNINTNVSSISSDTASIRTDTGIIKNNAQAIATSSGQAAAFAEDVANNTLEVKNKVVTIASDTTQMRADSGSIRADVSEIKNTLGLYLYNTIVTEDAEGAIANFDTDLKDYLQNAVVEIPADAGGIAGLFIVNQMTELEKAEIFRGLLLGTYKFINLGSLTWSYESAVDDFRSSGITDIKKPTAWHQALNFICPRYATQPSNSNADNGCITQNKDSTTIRIGDSSFGGDTIAFTNAMNGVYLIYELETPTTPTITKAQFEALSAAFGISINDYEVAFTSPITDGASVDLLSGIVKINTSPVTYDSITPLAIRTFKGVNNFYSDIGDIDVTYRETLKHYLEKQNNNSRSLNRNVNLLRENIEASDEDSDRRI